MTSKAQEIYDALVSDFPLAMQTVTDLSKNTSGNKNFINSNYVALNFDLIKNVSLGNSVKEKSPDALFFHDEKLYFIEFKEGCVLKEDIRLKIHEAVLTLFHFSISKGITDREGFLSLDIRYAVIMRTQTKGTPNASILDTLEATSTYFNLKNIEGLLVSQTQVAFRPMSISKLLHKVSAGKIAPAYLVHSDQLTQTELLM